MKTLLIWNEVTLNSVTINYEYEMISMKPEFSPSGLFRIYAPFFDEICHLKGQSFGL
jgi:hypothetical protein